MSPATSISGLSPERRRVEPATTGPREAKTFPLSYGQQQLWFVEQVAPGKPTYHIDNAKRLAVAVNVNVLRRCLEEMTRRHEILRTTFETREDGQPVQVVAPALSIELPVIDLRGLPETEQEFEAVRVATEEVRRPFSLTRGPLWRAGLLQRGEVDYILLFTIHHLITDGWSMGVLFRELAALYQAFSSGQPSPLSDLRVQYADFVTWQRHCSCGEEFTLQLDYWKSQLNELPVMNLPTDHVRPPLPSFRGACHSFSLPMALASALRALSRHEGVTLFTTLLAAFQALLQRYTGQDDIVVGTTIANRNREEFKELIGFFVNTVVLRTPLSGNPSFRSLLKRVREVVSGALAHQDLPFERLVQELQPQRDFSRNPLFQVAFQRLRGPRSTQDDPKIFSSWRAVHGGTAKVDLWLDVYESPKEFGGAFEYSTDLFDAPTIARMASHFHTLLEGVVADPDQRVSDLPILTQTERHELLAKGNNPSAGVSQDASIHRLFEIQVERSPDEVAVVFGEQAITFRELNRRANQIAHYLIAVGVCAETPVAICSERSIDAVVGILGILKAGGAYVPLDPSYPKLRLAFMLEETRAPVLLTQQRLARAIPSSEAKVLRLDADWDSIARCSDQNPTTPVTPANLGCVLFTSGSTGTPKGILATHRGFINRFSWMWRTYPFESHEVCCQRTALSFVDSVWEIFGPLLQGIRTVIIPDEVLEEPRSLLEVLADERVTRIVLVPSLMERVLDPDLARHLPHLKYWVSSGEALSPGLSEHFQACVPHGILINLYGSTEVSADVTCCEVTRHRPSARVPIGRPISNTNVHVLDRHLQPVPVGVPGELYVAGESLARGYLKAADLTAERFLPDPFSTRSGGRLFRTGDVARRLPDGDLEFLGRADQQVKLRGQRIELGEIEAVLRKQPAIREAVVTVWPSRAGSHADPRLVAYCVPAQQLHPGSAELRSFLESRLPRYMVPSVFLWVEALPRTPNGKVDRQALQNPEQTRPDSERRPYVPPGTPTEETLTAIWEEVLGIDRVGLRADFFCDLGGHSLLATQVLSRVRDRFQVEIPLYLFFQHSTVAALAERIDGYRSPTALDDDVTAGYVQGTL